MIDVAVAGAGLGGLSAAVHLARAGFSVAVFDRQPEAGGFATTYRRGAFTFEASLHLLDAVEPGQPNADVFESLGITGALDLRKDRFLRREVWPDDDVDAWMEPGLDALLATVARRFPAEEAGVSALLEQAAEVHATCYEFLQRGEDLPEGSQLAVLRLLSRTAADVIGDTVNDPKAVRLLGTLATYQGLDVDQIAALPFLIMLYGYHKYGGSYPIGGSRSLTEALCRVLVAHGGTLHLGHAVTRLLAARSVVRGLALDDGTTVEARHVVTGVSPLIVARDWIAADQLPARWRGRVLGMAPSDSLVRVSLGLDVDPRTIAPQAYETWVCGSFGPRGRWPLSITMPGIVDPSCAPNGGGVVQITTHAPSSPTPDLPREVRDATTAAMIAEVERTVLPGLSTHIVERDVAHPGTYARYGGVPHGAVFGFAATPAQSGARRLGARTPLRGLTLGGGWVFPGAGQTTALWSGRIAADLVARELA